MLIAARVVQGFLVVCLILMARIAAGDSQRGGHHAASIIFSIVALAALFGMATLAARHIAKSG